MLNKLLPAIVFVTLFFALPCFAQTYGTGTRAITDMRGKSVIVPDPLGKIATIDDGFVESVLTHLGEIDKVGMIGSWAMKRDYSYSFTFAGQKHVYQGLSTMRHLHPWLNDLVCVNSPQGNTLNFEALAAGNPDVVILRVGDTIVREQNAEVMDRVISTIEALGLPLVVIYAPNFGKTPDLASMREEARVIGSLFGKEEQAVALLDKLAATETIIRERTGNIPEADKPRLLYMGLNPDVRLQGGAGTVHGIDTPESYIIENVVNAKNAFQGKGAGIPISAEQIYALNPDVVILPTSNGYHPPEELYLADYFATLKELDAVQHRAIYAMPWTPMNAARRAEYPLDMLIIAKAAYPGRFQDINVYDFALQFYQDIYHVDEATARGLRSTQLLDWMKDINF